MEANTQHGLRLRPFARIDDDQVSSWFTDAGELRFFAGPRMVWPPDSEQWEQIRLDPTLTAWTAVLNDDPSVVGHGELIIENAETVRFARIGIAPPLRGRGLGRALGSALLEKAAEGGYRLAVLLVHAENASAIRSYRALGFHAVAGSSENNHRMRMELELNR
jgi:ribosomal protein S18 acetylase RimI-like enzyme